MEHLAKNFLSEYVVKLINEDKVEEYCDTRVKIFQTIVHNESLEYHLLSFPQCLFIHLLSYRSMI